jgi:hypothetical protein
MEKSGLAVKYWILKSGKPFRSFVTKAERALYLKRHNLRLGPRRYTLKDAGRFTLRD